METSLFLPGVLQVGLGGWHLCKSLPYRVSGQIMRRLPFRWSVRSSYLPRYLPTYLEVGRYLNTTYSVHNDGKTNPAWPPPSKDPVLALQVNSNITAPSWKLQTAPQYSISRSSVRLSSNSHQQPEPRHIEPRSLLSLARIRPLALFWSHATEITAPS